MATRYLYLLERIKDSGSYRKGERVWSHSKCAGWRVVMKVPKYN